ncbi:MAG: hypothetical protein U0531_16555 [Dehalococcoidia bacterium]
MITFSRRGNRDVGELPSQAGDGAVALELDVGQRPRPHRLDLPPVPGCVRRPECGWRSPAPARPRRPSRQASSERCQALGVKRLHPHAVGRFQALLDAGAALVQHAQDRWIDELPRDEQQYAEIDELGHEAGQIES